MFSCPVAVIGRVQESLVAPKIGMCAKRIPHKARLCGMLARRGLRETKGCDKDFGSMIYRF